MKKFFILSLLVISSLSCNEEQSEVVTQSKLSKADLEEIASEFNSMFSNTMEYVATQSPLISIYEANDDSVDVVLEAANIDQLTVDFLSDQYFEGATLDIENIDLEKVINFPEFGARVNTSATVFDLTNTFSENQKALLIPFSEQMMSLTDFTNGSELITAFNDQVIVSSDLSDEEKIQLIEFSSGFHAMIGFFKNGGMDQMYEKIYGESSSEGRKLDCSIDIRSVWAGAVIGLSIGAVRGGIAGFFAGSFTVPVLGTATGTVGGAVFGGAAGFVGGAISSIASGLLLTCGRPTPRQSGYASASCSQMGSVMGLAGLPSVCYNNITYRSPAGNFKTNYTLITGR